MAGKHTRVRVLISENLGLVLLGLIVVGLLGGFLTYGTFVDPDTRTESVRTATWTSTGSFDHTATVTEGAGPFSEGAVLRNRSVYFTRVTPRLDGAFAYEYEATGGGNLTVRTTVSLVTQSTSTTDEGEGEVVYWRQTRRLGSETSVLGSGQRQEVPFSTNVTAAKRRADATERRLGGTPGTVEASLLSRVEITGTRNGESVDRTRTYRLPIRFQQGIYRVQGEGTRTAEGNLTESRTVPVERGPVGETGGPLLVAVALCGLVGVAAGRSRGWLTVLEAERSTLEYRRQRDEFDSWISVGRVPESALSSPEIEVDSLADLVDTAIDMDHRVVEDRERGRFVLLAPNATYVYTHPDPDAGTPAPPVDEEGGDPTPQGATPEE
jgi:hypothetical protein